MQQRWSEEKIVEMILELHRSGERINSNQIQLRQRALYAAAIKYFGSWGKAIRAAGLDYQSVRAVKPFRRWSKTAIVRAIRARKRKKLPINGQAVSREDSSFYHAARRYFGKRGWRKALRKAGVDPRMLDPRRIWTKDKVLKEIRRFLRAGFPLYGHHLCQHGQQALFAAGCKLFGNWRGAVEAAGLDYDAVRAVRNRWWSKRRIIAEIRRLERNGIRLSSKAIHHSRGDLFGAAVAHFSSWSQAVTAAGIDYRRHSQTWSYKAWLRRLTGKQVAQIKNQAMKFASERGKLK